MTATITFPPVVTQYAAADVGALNLADTESRFNLDGPASDFTTDNAVKYTLPGLPFNINLIPTERLLVANLSSGGSAVILPPDWGQQPRPSLADFRGIFLRWVGDFARVQWTGRLWTIVETSPGVQVATIGQDPL